MSREQQGPTKKLKFTEHQLKKANKVRNSFGLSRIVVKNRDCLRCGFNFESMGYENRLCDLCNKYAPSQIDWGVKVNAKGG